jgi:hypothetical protein
VADEFTVTKPTMASAWQPSGRERIHAACAYSCKQQAAGVKFTLNRKLYGATSNLLTKFYFLARFRFAPQAGSFV